MAKKVTYQDAKSPVKYEAHTNTSPVTPESGASLREEIVDAGDYTQQLPGDGPKWGTTLSIAPMGCGRG